MSEGVLSYNLIRKLKAFFPAKRKNTNNLRQLCEQLRLKHWSLPLDLCIDYALGHTDQKMTYWISGYLKHASEEKAFVDAIQMYCTNEQASAEDVQACLEESRNAVEKKLAAKMG